MIYITLFAEPFFAREANGIHTALLQLEERFQDSDRVLLSINKITAETDVIHAHTVGLHYLLQSIRNQKRLIVTAHVVPNICLGGVKFERVCRLFSKKYLRLVYNRARLVIAVSPLVKQELRQLGVKTDIVTICNSVDRQKFKPDPVLKVEFRQKLKLKPDDFVVLGVGQIQPRKGIKSFVAVAERLPHMKFVWVGGWPFGRFVAEYEALSHLIEHPPANVIFTDVVPYDDMPGYYATADAFLFPSLHECFSYAILEAGAANLPIVLWDSTEYPEYLYDHYLKAQDEDGLAECLLRLSKERAYRYIWQEEAANLAKRYDVEHFMEQLTMHYHLIAEN